MAIVDLSVVPVGTKTPGVSEYVREAVKVIKESGLKYSVSPMGTAVEGDLKEIFSLVLKIHERLVAMGCQRLLTTIKIDDRRDKFQTMEEKVNKVI
ncbi:MAG: MTH1187 family thiamine-binding protein [candidate division WOR-3 bacterium]